MDKLGDEAFIFIYCLNGFTQNG